MKLAPTAALVAATLAVAGWAHAQYAGPVYTDGQTSETPAFEVIATDRVEAGTIEVRRYAPYIAAQVEVRAETERAAAARGFGPLANYIFGANAPGDRIAMTEPVRTAPSGGTRIAMTEPVRTTPEVAADTYVVQFMMPSAYDLSTLPAPTDPRVSLVEVPARTLATLRWTGGRSDAAVGRATDALRAWVERRAADPVGPVTVAQYDSPSVRRADQRWEVQVELTAD